MKSIEIDGVAVSPDMAKICKALGLRPDPSHTSPRKRLLTGWLENGDYVIIMLENSFSRLSDGKHLYRPALVRTPKSIHYLEVL